jgi:hypothetical protein
MNDIKVTFNEEINCKQKKYEGYEDSSDAKKSFNEKPVYSIIMKYQFS